VDQVESGDLTGLATQAMVAHYTAPLVAAGVDTLVLGCTHYPFLRPLIGDAVGPGVTIVDTGTAVADHLRHVLAERASLADRTRPGVARFWTSGDPCVVQPVMARLWREPVALQRLPEAYR
jgi:glutamate racemase